MKNSSFKEQFVTSFMDQANVNYNFDRCQEILQDFTDTYVPELDANIKYTIIANIIFTIPPAATIAILFGIDTLLNAPVSSERVSSPSILTKPPNGIKRKAYFVSFPCFENISGPNPIANWFTFTLQSLATRKWPPSCINIKKPSKNIIFIAEIIKFNKFPSNILHK